MFFLLFFPDTTAALLCALYRPQWQGSALLTSLTDQQDTIIYTHGYQNILIEGDLT